MKLTKINRNIIPFKETGSFYLEDQKICKFKVEKKRKENAFTYQTYSYSIHYVSTTFVTNGQVLEYVHCKFQHVNYPVPNRSAYLIVLAKKHILYLKTCRFGNFKLFNTYIQKKILLS
jgi:hypothetical protein